MGRGIHSIGAGLLLLGLTSCLAPALAPGSVRIVGAVEMVEVEEAGLFFNAAIEPDRKSTAIHVTDLVIDGMVAEPSRNIGKRIRFFVENERGERQVINTRVSGLSRYDDSAGEPVLYLVPLTLSIADIERLVLVELANRSGDSHKLSIGRDWVGADLRVDRKRRLDD